MLETGCPIDLRDRGGRYLGEAAASEGTAADRIEVSVAEADTI